MPSQDRAGAFRDEKWKEKGMQKVQASSEKETTMQEETV